ncbi:hypothetical protein C0Q70_05811 [Pomacea canaliculata]|uniref:Neurotransmitter-gated ion-channel ligand-binding domain-containing protein n=1 Tax=Pomacea canaliculata TaxID=400727 RepID=A0A2T7PM79_POMCA|nr:hypothetical protein C0Q70_05811 [Pomacea canaliculata]
MYHATKVAVQIHILSIDSINEQSMDYSLNMYLRQRWIDPRLQFVNHSRSEWLELDTKIMQKVWVPDTFFRNEKKGAFHDVTVPNRLMHLYTEMARYTTDYTMTFYLRRKWVDERLAFTSFPGAEVLELDTRVIDKLWVPDIYFRNEKSASVHNVTVPNRLLHLHKNGTVLYSSRLSMTLSCQMDLTLFPLDVQSCPLIIQSYSYTTANVDFQWTQADGKVTKADDLEMARFIDAGVITADCIGMYESQFACIMATFMLKRHVGYFLVHMFLPSVLVVILSWVSFWIDSAATAAPHHHRSHVHPHHDNPELRGAGNFAQSIIHQGDDDAIDVWMSTCVAFVFAALLEYAYVNTLSRQEELFRRDVRDSNSRKQDTEVLEREIL